jgi:hypothetical protein
MWQSAIWGMEALDIPSRAGISLQMRMPDQTISMV